jgi:hypothetical protein
VSFPYLFEANFAGGGAGEWDSESDTGALLDFPAYHELARTPGMGMPFRGAHCARLRLGDTNDHTLTAGAVNVSADGTFGCRFALFLGNDVAATADDTFNIFELQASATVELAVGLRITAATGAIEIGIGEVAPTAFASALMTRGRWYQVEVDGNLDDGVGDDGDANLRLAGTVVATIASLDQGAITDALLGTQNTLATTTGTILLDEFVADDERVGLLDPRWPVDVLLTKSGHAFVGPGVIENITLVSGAGADNVMELFDSDDAGTAKPFKARLANTANGEIVDPAGMPIEALVRGAFISLSGTNPRAMVKIKRAVAFGSEGAVRDYALRR